MPVAAFGCPTAMNCSSSANVACCFGPDGTSPYDLDGDGFIGCDEPCGSLVAACSSNATPCDCDDSNPLIYPGNGC
jgi:hypothetical protein